MVYDLIHGFGSLIQPRTHLYQILPNLSHRSLGFVPLLLFVSPRPSSRYTILNTILNVSLRQRR